MKGKAWGVKRVTKGLLRHTLKLNKDYTLSVDFCHDPADENCVAPTSAMMTLEFAPLQTPVMSAIVMNEWYDWPVEERVVRSRLAAINKARSWQKQISKSIRALKLPLHNAEA